MADVSNHCLIKYWCQRQKVKVYSQSVLRNKDGHKHFLLIQLYARKNTIQE